MFMFSDRRNSGSEKSRFAKTWRWNSKPGPERNQSPARDWGQPICESVKYWSLETCGVNMSSFAARIGGKCICNYMYDMKWDSWKSKLTMKSKKLRHTNWWESIFVLDESHNLKWFVNYYIHGNDGILNHDTFMRLKGSPKNENYPIIYSLSSQAILVVCDFLLSAKHNWNYI